MKKNLIFVVATFVLLVAVLSCTDNKVNDNLVSPNVNSDANGRLSSEAIDYETEGIFVYKTLKYHSLHFDPLTLIPEKERANFKAKIDSAKATKSNNPDLVWDNAVKSKKISVKTASKLKKFRVDAISAINANSSPNIVDKWFVDEIAKTKDELNLSFDEKDYVIHHSTIMRYVVKAYLETNVTPNNPKNGRATASCTIQMISCYWGNISTYQGIGGFVGAVGGPPGSAVGSAVGALIGALIGFQSCTCDSDPCAYPKFISTPDICYNQFYGLEFLAGGFGSGTQSLYWEFANLQGIVFLAKSGTANTTRVYNSELLGNQTFQVRVTAYCDGGSYITQYVIINTDILGKPSFFLSGNTYPQVGSPQFYSISGRNLNTVNWGVGSIGQISTQNSYGINVQWNATGYAYLYANAESSCGLINNGLNVVVHN